MKKVCIIILALVTSIGFSQDKDQRKEMRQKMMQERQDLTPHQKAELNTKRLTLQLDLTEAQQKEVQKLQLEMITNREAQKEDRKAKVEEVGFYEKATTRLEIRQQYQDKMKAILSESQYTVWKEDIKKSKRSKAVIRQQRKQ
jgi:protein CpxP